MIEKYKSILVLEGEGTLCLLFHVARGSLAVVYYRALLDKF